MADKSAFVALPSAPPAGYTPPSDDFFSKPPTPELAPAAPPAPAAAPAAPAPKETQQTSCYAGTPQPTPAKKGSKGGQSAMKKAPGAPKKADNWQQEKPSGGGNVSLGYCTLGYGIWYTVGGEFVRRDPVGWREGAIVGRTEEGSLVDVWIPQVIGCDFVILCSHFVNFCP